MALIRLDTADSVTETKIPQLTGISNYYAWHTRIQVALEEWNLWSVASDLAYLAQQLQQSDTQSDAAYATAVFEYLRDNKDSLKESKRATGHIKKTLLDLVLATMPCSGTAYMLFKSITDKFEMKISKLQTHYLLSDLYQTNYNNGDDLPEFLATTNSVIGRLASHQYVVSSFEQANIILTAFRNMSYEQHIATILSTEQFDPEKIQSMLKMEWTWRQHDISSVNASPSGNGTVLYSQNS
jgi:hypothetical protein